MVRNYSRKINQENWSEGDTQKALKGLRNKTLTYTKATKLYKIPRATLY